MNMSEKTVRTSLKIPKYLWDKVNTICSDLNISKTTFMTLACFYYFLELSKIEKSGKKHVQIFNEMEKNLKKVFEQIKKTL